MKIPVVDDVWLSHEQEVYPTTSLHEYCIEFEFQMDRNYYVDLRQTCLVFKLKFAMGHCHETYNSKQVKKEHKEEAEADVETPVVEEEQEV